MNIVLYEPEIPSNTGNIARTCAITGARLHLIEPLGFSLEDKYLKRAGLDYWEYLDINIYKNIPDEKKILSPWIDEERRGKSCWTGFIPKEEDIYLDLYLFES